MRGKFPGGHAGGVTPVPISNTEVKPSRADDTAAVRQWESRTLPGLNKRSAGFGQQAVLFPRRGVIHHALFALPLRLGARSAPPAQKVDTRSVEK